MLYTYQTIGSDPSNWILGREVGLAYSIYPSESVANHTAEGLPLAVDTSLHPEGNHLNCDVTKVECKWRKTLSFAEGVEESIQLTVDRGEGTIRPLGKSMSCVF